MSRARGASIGGRTVGTPATRVKPQTRTIEPITLAPNLSCGITNIDGINIMITTPDSAGLSPVGDLDCRALVNLNDWTPSSEQVLFAKVDAYKFRTVFGNLYLDWTTTGGIDQERISSTDTGFTDGTENWIRATLDVNNGAGGHDVKFYTSSDGSSWTQLGTTSTFAGTSSVRDSANQVDVGSGLDGVISYLEIRDGIGGTVVASPDFRDRALDTVSFVDDQGNTWTITAYGEWVEC